MSLNLKFNSSSVSEIIISKLIINLIPKVFPVKWMAIANKCYILIKNSTFHDEIKLVIKCGCNCSWHAENLYEIWAIKFIESFA